VHILTGRKKYINNLVRQQAEIIDFQQKKLIGLRMLMSFTDNRTSELWRQFMPRRKEIKNRHGDDRFSVEVYPGDFWERFDAGVPFEKWAAVEVTDFEQVPTGMEQLVIPTGRYAVFIHRGPAGTGHHTYRYIFETWLPRSGFRIDGRPHFALMDKSYKPDDPASEETIRIPVNASG
jgi:AraC family transcriptional regulator